MRAYKSVVILSLLAYTNASVLNTVLAGATTESVLTIPADARAAIAKLRTGRANATSLSTAEVAAISSRTTTAQADNTASKTNLGSRDGSAGNIALGGVTSKISIHVSESARQQIALGTKGTAASETDVNLLICSIRQYQRFWDNEQEGH